MMKLRDFSRHIAPRNEQHISLIANESVHAFSTHLFWVPVDTAEVPVLGHLVGA